MDQFFKMKIKNSKRHVFFIDWNQNSPTAKWMSDKPEIVDYESTVSWRGTGTTIILCCVDDNSGRSIFPNYTTHYNVPLLKSLLQKSIRRQIDDLALMCAKQLIMTDIDSFLRRLFVIMLEDVQLHQCCSGVIWLTSAVTKGYQITYRQVDWLMGLVKYLCHDNHKFYKRFVHYPNINVKGFLKMVDMTPIDDTQRTIIYSIMYRYSYGGMKPDLDMFYYYANNYLGQFIDHIQLEYVAFAPININDIKPLRVGDILINSVDFHCYPQMITIIHNKFPELTDAEIHDTIWECNSKTNTRWNDPIIPELSKIWETIHAFVEQLQRNLIDQKKYK